MTSDLSPYTGWRSFLPYERFAMGYMVSLGWQPHQAAAIIGNLAQESGMNPNAVNRNDQGPGEDSQGIAQWGRGRLANMKLFVGSMFKADYAALSDAEKFSGQLSFVDRELRGVAYTAARNLLLAAGPSDLTLAGRFGLVFEGFSDHSEAHRNAYAAAALAVYGLTRTT